jgi:hypothetical protein
MEKERKKERIKERDFVWKRQNKQNKENEQARPAVQFFAGEASFGTHDVHDSGIVFYVFKAGIHQNLIVGKRR